MFKEIKFTYIRAIALALLFFLLVIFLFYKSFDRFRSYYREQISGTIENLEPYKLVTLTKLKGRKGDVNLYLSEYDTSNLSPGDSIFKPANSKYIHVYKKNKAEMEESYTFAISKDELFYYWVVEE